MIRNTLTIISLIGAPLAAIIGCLSTMNSMGVLRNRDLTELFLFVMLAAVALTLLLLLTAGILNLIESLVMVLAATAWSVYLSAASLSNPGLCVWLIVGLALTGMYAGLGSPMALRRKRKKLGLCLKCGYDLRASEERCPECGQEFETTCSAKP